MLESAQDGQQEHSHKLWEDFRNSQETLREGPSRPGAQTARRVRTEEQERGQIKLKSKHLEIPFISSMYLFKYRTRKKSTIRRNTDGFILHFQKR